MLDKAKSYKIVGGKFVERTAEELVRLERLKAEQAARELAPAKNAASAARLPRAKGRFVMLTAWQAERLLRLEHVCWPLFTILLFENFRQRGQPFILPTRPLNTVRGPAPDQPASGADPIGDVRPDFDNTEPAKAAADRASVGGYSSVHR